MTEMDVRMESIGFEMAHNTIQVNSDVSVVGLWVFRLMRIWPRSVYGTLRGSRLWRRPSSLKVSSYWLSGYLQLVSFIFALFSDHLVEMKAKEDQRKSEKRKSEFSKASKSKASKKSKKDKKQKKDKKSDKKKKKSKKDKKKKKDK